MKLHDYQLVAQRWLFDHPHAGLFLEPGLGKTVTTITAVDGLKMLGDIERVLLVAPLRVARDTWPAELAKWHDFHDLTHAVAMGTPAQRRDALAAEADVTITNVENLVWLLDEYGPAKSSKLPFDMLVIDELSIFKGRKGTRVKELAKHRRKFKRVVGLTGTPVPNTLADLWAQMRILDGGETLGRAFTPFRAAYFELGRLGNGEYKDKRFDSSYQLQEGADELIYEAIGKNVISMRTKDHLDLPARTDNDVWLDFTPKLRKEYRRFVKEKVLELEEATLTAANAAVLAGKLAQFTSGQVYDEDGVVQEIHRLKVEAIRGIVDELQGSPVIVFYAYKHERDRLLKEFPEAELYVEGSRDRWNAGEIPMLLLHPKSASHGLNLQEGGHTIIWATLTYSGELYVQGNARVDRQGQTEPVVVHHLLIRDTVDPRILSIVQGKVDGQDTLLDAMRAEVG